MGEASARSDVVTWLAASERPLLDERCGRRNRSDW
jgi:hypothetical protein